LLSYIDPPLYWLRDLNQLQIVSLPPEMQELGAYCFQNCYSLRKIYISPSIKKIDLETFDSCYALKQIQRLDNNTSHNLEDLGEHCFRHCFNVEWVEFLFNIFSL
jgi:hypothetical protein